MEKQSKTFEKMLRKYLRESGKTIREIKSRHYAGGRKAAKEKRRKAGKRR
jgi:hypothetical protein